MESQNKPHQLKAKYLITGTIKALSGLHIGGSNTSMDIGGVDSSVIRNAVTNVPYIPGSSLKGKMRSLVELTYGSIGTKRMGAVENGPTNDPETIAGRLFGVIPEKSGDPRQRPSRIIVRDAELDEERFDNSQTELPYSEVKTEVVIDRITSKAMPRQIERVPAGAEFKLNLTVNVFDEDMPKDKGFEGALVQHTLLALQLVQDDYIGGHGSRGSGQVAFKIDDIQRKDVKYYQTASNEYIQSVKSEYEDKFPELF